MEKGDIILIPFPFTDLSGNKKRPALVLVSGDIDIIVAFISTQIKWKENTDVLLNPSNENGLKKDSLVRLSKLATIDKYLAIGLADHISEREHDHRPCAHYGQSQHCRAASRSNTAATKHHLWAAAHSRRHQPGATYYFD